LLAWLAVTAAPESVMVPFAGSVESMTACSASPSIVSVKPKSATAKVYGVSSRIVCVVSVPLGSSLIGVTSKVSVLGF